MARGSKRPPNIELGVPTQYGFTLTRQQFERTAPHIRVGAQSLMDLGCGNGANTALFAQVVPHVVGVDIEHERLSAAREYARTHGLNNVEYAISDGTVIPYPDDAFDHVTCFDVLEHVDDEQQVLNEIGRVLHPDGRLTISVPNKWYLMETHGLRLKPQRIPWNLVPLLWWLPTSNHERFAHARIYTKRRILSALDDADFEVLQHQYAMPPFDLIGNGLAQKLLTVIFTSLANTPLRVIGIRHFVLAAPQPG